MYTIAKDSIAEGKISKQTIEDAIKTNEKNRAEYNLMESYYDGDHPILKRAKAEGLKNNKVVINHAEYITDLYVGYLFGTPIDYTVDESLNHDVIDPITDAFKRQTISLLDTEIATDVSIYGKAYEYVYADEDAQLKSVKIDPRTCVVAYDNTMNHKKLFAVMYGKINSVKGEYEDVVVVTDTDIIEYNKNLTEASRINHAFGRVPVIEYRNNTKERGDFKQVISLINAYNLLQSDRINDKEQLVEALLVLYGFKLTPEATEKLKEWRILSAPAQTNGTKAEYLTKVFNETELDILRARIEADIHKISKTPNMSDENFVGNASGVAIRFKLLPFEWQSTKKVRFHEFGLIDRFTLYNTWLNKKNSANVLIEPHLIDAVFSRSLPNNDFETSQMINNLDGKVSDATLISQLSFVKDADAETEAVTNQKKENIKLLAPQFATNEPNKPADNPEDNSNV